MNIIIKECSSKSQGSWEVCPIGRWLVLMLTRLLTTVCKVTDRGSKDLRYPRMSLSGWKFGAWVHSFPELRREVYCAEKWAPCQQDPPPSSLEVEAQRQGLLAKPWGPTRGSEPQLHWGQPPWRVWLGSKGSGGWWPENPVPRFPWPRLASDSAALQRNCAPDNCTGVSNASESLTGPQRPGVMSLRVDIPPRAPNFHQEAAEALGKPTSSLHIRCNNAGKLPWVRVFCRLFDFVKIKTDLHYISIDSENSHQKCLQFV